MRIHHMMGVPLGDAEGLCNEGVGADLDLAEGLGVPVMTIYAWNSRGGGPRLMRFGSMYGTRLPMWKRGRTSTTRSRRRADYIWLRHTGWIWIVAAGRCRHNAPSVSPFHRNNTGIGIEAENAGRTPWLSAQLDAYHALRREGLDGQDQHVWPLITASNPSPLIRWKRRPRFQRALNPAMVAGCPGGGAHAR
ncbi:hypothetical protein [Acrocarpospora macrocephala]|uniref:hypothetical protein n=1 Tax=Acrocarpospora macrocephala TaxID=150177 RepID=UPI001C3FCEC9|nr:hypothetical protein [Acrocarpospora macrocephala]